MVPANKTAKANQACLDWQYQTMAEHGTKSSRSWSWAFSNLYTVSAKKNRTPKLCRTKVWLHTYEAIHWTRVLQAKCIANMLDQKGKIWSQLSPGKTVAQIPGGIFLHSIPQVLDRGRGVPTLWQRPSNIQQVSTAAEGAQLTLRHLHLDPPAHLWHLHGHLYHLSGHLWDISGHLADFGGHQWHLFGHLWHVSGHL